MLNINYFSRNLDIMLKKYLQNFKNLPREIWIIAIITFINRAGTMVIPFLSKYLKEDLGFSYSQIGWIMFSFGIGSLLGTYLSGKIADKLGAYKVMIFSLFTSGLIFIMLQFIRSFELMCAGVMLLTFIADMFRPAMMVTLNSYVGVDHRLKALALIRAAVNLGFLIGPALGGLIIFKLGYSILFYIDGISCITAILIFAFLIKEVKSPYKLDFKHLKFGKIIPFQDNLFLLNWIIALLTGVVFFQIFTTLPLYHEEFFGLSEFYSGLLLAFNGLLILLFEIPLVNYIQRKKIRSSFALTLGLASMSIAYLLLCIISHPIVLVIMMVFISFGVMLTFPFASDIVMKRSYKRQEGVFMSIFQMSYGFAHVFSAKTGMEVISKFGYQANWFVNFGISIIAMCLAYLLYIYLKKEKIKKHDDIVKSIFG
ncbi:MFS transporter [Neotamlana laminarinivorans]|uniref:MFS transporter n=1 Tax=Neotamlana laminarinivorans TaxID=2883124 RepID=A0A9X1HZV4_9FLAO|nr:MFS transporter [Tamlana laminarinivorans]MCB4798380.1 MFS transporter [Tamlana laminarinivorans]